MHATDKKRNSGALRGVIFDMDGTLTEPVIDFAEMRRRLGIPQGDILATVRSWPELRQRTAFDVIEEIEEDARRRMTLREGTVELLGFLDGSGIRKGLITRNTVRTVDCLVRRLGTDFSEVVTREFDPVKPDPASALHVSRRWGIAPSEIILLGDYRDDLLCGNAAGMKTCLLKTDRNHEFAALAHYVVDDLRQFRDLVARLA
jgi:HAD superfamily hydrolase (TIGR01549 family)